MNRVIGVVTPDPDGSGTDKPKATRTTYDGVGRITKVETGTVADQSDASWAALTVLQTSDYAYDVMGRKTRSQIKGTDGVVRSLTQYSYDVVGRLECTAVRMNPAVYGSLPASACTHGAAGSQGPDRITKNVYDAAGQLLQVRQALGTPLEQAYATYSYTPNGKQQYVIDANGNRALLEYDGFDRLKRWNFPAQTALSATALTAFTAASPANAVTLSGAVNVADYEQYGYDANGNRTSLRKRDGSLIGYSFDALNRMTSKVVPERAGLPATHSRDVYYSYDLRGLMTAARFDSPAGEGVTTSYDGFGRITSSVLAMDGVSRTLSYLYDANGNRTRLTYPDGGYVRYQYDGLDRPVLLGGNASDWSRTYGYSAAGHLTGEVLSGTGGTVSYGRDAIGRLSSLSRDVAGTASDFTNSFTYNPASQVTTLTRSNPAYAWTGAYNVNRAYTPNGLNQYANVGGTAFCHDANGNLTADGSYVYLYDVENRLVEKRSQTNTDCAALSYGGGLRGSLRYDPMGRLYESGGVVTGTTRYLVDGDALVAEYGSSGTMLRRYVHGADGKADDPVAWYEGAAMVNGAVRLLHGNHQGSIVLASDVGGTAQRLFSYDEYGIARAGDSAPLLASNGARFLYTGQAWLPDLGLYHYKARVYSPTLGRFLQTDPIGYNDQINLYAYVANDPVNRSDPSGLAQVCTSTTGSRIQSCVGVDGNGDGNVKDNDLTSGQKSKLGSSFHDAIVANNGRNIGSLGKPVSNDASNPATSGQMAMTRAVSQFIGASVSGNEARQWANVQRIWTSRDNSLFGRNNEFIPNTRTGQAGEMVIGRRVGWFQGSIYSNPSGLARVLLHEMQHSSVGYEYDGRVDARAIELLRGYGLDGGGCPAANPLTGGSGC